MTEEENKNESADSDPVSQTDQPSAEDSPGDNPSSSPAEPSQAEPGTGLAEDHVREALKEVIDPELFVNIVDLGLIYTVDVKNRDDGQYDVDVEMTMTSPMCPAGPQLVGNSRQVIEALPNVVEVDVKVVMDPPWTQDMMSEDAKDQLNIF